MKSSIHVLQIRLWLGETLLSLFDVRFSNEECNHYCVKLGKYTTTIVLRQHRINYLFNKSMIIFLNKITLKDMH